MIGGVQNIGRITELRQRILFTFGMLAVYRVGAYIVTPGIEPEVFEQLATPFFTTRVGGTGLGLAVSRHWVARHGGSLRLESEPGRGTRVRVFLPIGGPEPDPHASRGQAKPSEVHEGGA